MFPKFSLILFGMYITFPNFLALPYVACFFMLASILFLFFVNLYIISKS